MSYSSDDEAWMYSCDPEVCSQCNPTIAKFERDAQDLYERSNSNSCKDMLKKLMDSYNHFSIEGTTFSLLGYIRYGYENGEAWDDLTENEKLEIEDSIREMYAIVYVDVKET